MPECERKTRHDYEHRSHCKGVLKVHLIFVTRFRKPCLTGDLARNCKEILTDIAEHHGWIIQKIETDKDHVHMLLQYPPTDCISGIVQCMKQQSTFKMWQLYETELRHLYWYQNTLWSKGYFYCSIGDVSTKIIEQYIENQV